jgi:hypothetical protein
MASNTTRKTILIKGDFDGNHGVEGQATVAIKPGMLIDYATSQKTIKRYVGAADQARIQPMFAVENDISPAAPVVGSQSMGIDTNYAVGDRVYGFIANRGDQILALLDTGATAVVFGDLLQSHGDGTLAKRTASNTVVARALEAVDNSAGSTYARILVEIL